MAIYALEERILFDAAAPGDADAADDLSDAADKGEIEAEQEEKQSSSDSKETKESSKDDTGDESETEKKGDDESGDSEKSQTASKDDSDTTSQNNEDQSETTDESLADSESEETEDTSQETADATSATDEDADDQELSDSGTSKSSDESDDEALTIEEEDDEKRKDIVFINESLDDLDAIIEAIDEDTEVVVVGADESGLDVISDTLKDREDVDAVHIFSHGGDGHFVLGRDVIRDANGIREACELLFGEDAQRRFDEYFGDPVLSDKSRGGETLSSGANG